MEVLKSQKTFQKPLYYLHYKSSEMMDLKQIVNITVPVPEEVLLSLRVENSEFASQMARFCALKLFEGRKLSIGQSAAFAGMDETDFIRFLGQHRVSIFGSTTDVAEDYQNA